MYPFGSAVQSWSSDPFSLDIALVDARILNVLPVHCVEAQETLAICKRAAVLVPLEATCRKLRVSLHAVGLTLAPSRDSDGTPRRANIGVTNPFSFLFFFFWGRRDLGP